MPVYTVQHITPLSSSQKDKLAEGITELHATKFHAPSLFVNVVFVDLKKRLEDGEVRYVAGKRKTSNQILANVRHGPSRTQEMYNDLCKCITTLWTSIVESPLSESTNGTSHKPSNDQDDPSLRAIFILGDIVAGAEAGFPLPEAGKDREWMEEHMEGFRRSAEEGDEDLKGLVAEIGRRGEEFGVF